MKKYWKIILKLDRSPSRWTFALRFQKKGFILGITVNRYSERVTISQYALPICTLNVTDVNLTGSKCFTNRVAVPALTYTYFELRNSGSNNVYTRNNPKNSIIYSRTWNVLLCIRSRWNFKFPNVSASHGQPAAFEPYLAE